MRYRCRWAVPLPSTYSRSCERRGNFDNGETSGMETQQSFPAWLSRVRGLMLGLALDDSSTDAHKSDFSGRRRAGAATELAAWTVEGLLRDRRSTVSNSAGSSIAWPWTSR